MELLSGTFPSPCTPGPLPIPPPETPALFCVKAQGAPQAEGCRQEPQPPPSHFFRIPICQGVNQKGAQTTFFKNGARFWHEKRLSDFVEESYLVLLPLLIRLTLPLFDLGKNTEMQIKI